MENLGRLMQFVTAFAEEQGFQQKKIQAIELATEEALVNIFNYAYPDGEAGEVELRCKMDNDHHLVMEISDTGLPFDPESLSEPDLDATISGRAIGGLGVFFIRKMVDEMKYRREGEKNILTLIIYG
jgi:anti-sigma regulatory factor (Ser/Thr protein kinase)